MRKLLLLILISTLLTACFGDSSDETSGGRLFSGHKLVTNKFSINLPSDQTFNTSDTIDIVLTHQSPVSVTGTPRLVLTIGANTRYADYLSGSTTSNLTFRYTVQASDEDNDGLNIGTTIDLNSGTLLFSNSGVSTAANTTLSSLDTSGLLVGDPGPVVTSVTLPTDATYIAAQNLDFTLTFDQAVLVTGLPRLTITLTTGTVYADYESGSNSTDLVFRYSVIAADEDLDGIALAGSIDLNLGSIKNAANVDSALGHTAASTVNINVDAQVPTIGISSAPNINTSNESAYSANGTCSEEGETVTVNIGGTDFFPTCTIGLWDTGNLDLSAMGDIDPLTITADIDDAAGNSAAQASVSRLKDTDAPDISSNTITANTYITDDILSMSIVFDQPVIVTGTPRVQLTFGTHVTNPIYLSYGSGSTTNTLVFNYTIVAGEEDTDGIDIEANISLNSGTISDVNANPSTLNLSSTSFGTVLVYTSNADITSLIEPVSATYAEGGEILLQVNYDEAVTISGTPRIALDIGGTTRYATYSSGSTTSGLEFSYTIQAGENDSDGIEISGINIDLNSGSIVSTATAIPVYLNFSAYKDPTTGVLVDTTSIIVPPDQVAALSTAPTISNTTLGVSWTVPNSNGTPIIDYSLQYRVKGESTWINKSPSPTTNSTSVTGLSEGVIYEFRVAANNGFLGSFSPVSEAEIFDVMSLSPIAWLDATNINGDGTSPSDGTKIDNWVDLTGAATNATELTPANQPTIEYAAQNGLPAARFDNHAVGLQGTFTRSLGTDLTFIVVGQHDSGYSDKCLFEFKGPGSERGFFIDRRYASNTMYSPALTKNSFQLWRIEDNGVTATVTENTSTQLFSGATMFGTDFIGTGTYVLGDDATGGNRMYGYISEFLVFDKALSPSEISALETYLKNKWGTP